MKFFNPFSDQSPPPLIQKPIKKIEVKNDLYFYSDEITPMLMTKIFLDTAINAEYKNS